MLKNIFSKTKIKPVIFYIEVPITVHCNLKCNYCGFFSNIVDREVFVDIEDFKKDVKELSSKVEIKQIRLLGGEPLLHPDINLFMTELRKAFPTSTLNIVTNGILIPQMKEDFWETLKENRIILDITYYQIWNNNFCKVLEVIKKNQVEDYSVKDTKVFYEQLNLKGDSDIEKTYKLCLCKECINLWNHKLYPCQNALRQFYNEKYNTNMELPPGVDFYKLSGSEIYKKLIKERKPFRACRFCLESGILHKWSRYIPDENQI